MKSQHGPHVTDLSSRGDGDYIKSDRKWMYCRRGKITGRSATADILHLRKFFKLLQQICKILATKSGIFQGK